LIESIPLCYPKQISNKIFLHSVGTQPNKIFLYSAGTQINKIFLYSAGTQPNKIFLYSVGTQTIVYQSIKVASFID
jgi:hypothetical protein